MIVTTKLTANVESIVDLQKNANLIQVSNKSSAAIYLKAESTVTVGDINAEAVQPNSSEYVSFGLGTCRNLHMIGSADASVDITVMSAFKPVSRGTLVANVETTVDLVETAREIEIQNLGTTNSIFYCIGGLATVDGSNCIELPPGFGTTEEGISKVSLISAGAMKYQVLGRRQN